MSNENETSILRKTIKIYYEKSTAIHIKFKQDYWKNGFILDLGDEDYFMLNEFLEGEMPVFYTQIKEITPYSKKGETDDISN